MGLVASGTTLMVSDPTNTSLLEVSLATDSVESVLNAGTSTGVGIPALIESPFPILSFGDVYYVTQDASCYYSCGPISVLNDYSLGSSANLWADTLPISTSTWYVTEANGLVYASAATTSLNAYGASSGATDWSLTTPYDIATQPTVGGGILALGYTTSPEISGFVYYSGAYAWNYTADSPVGSPALAYSNGSFFFGTTGGHIDDVNTSGHLLWSYSDGGNSITTTPAIGFGRVFVGASDGTLYALNESTGSLSWSAHLPSALSASPVISANGEVYVADANGDLTAFNASSGHRTWFASLGAAANDGLLLGNGTLLASNALGVVSAYAAQTYNVTFSESGLPAGTA